MTLIEKQEECKVLARSVGRTAFFQNQNFNIATSKAYEKAIAKIYLDKGYIIERKRGKNKFVEGLTPSELSDLHSTLKQLQKEYSKRRSEH